VPLANFVVPTEAYPDFLLRCCRQGRVCGFPQRKPHEARGTHWIQQEIRGSAVEGSAVPPDLQQNPFHTPRVGNAGGRLIRNKFSIKPPLAGAISDGEAAVRALIGGVVDSFPHFHFEPLLTHHADNAVIVEGG
jgi:hypothetical protein